MPVLLDIVALVILVSSAFAGWKKGLVLTAAGFVSTLLAVFIAWNVASAASEPLGGWMEQYMEQSVGEAVKRIAAEQGISPDIPALPAGELLEAAETALKGLGFSRLSQSPLADAVVRKMKDEGMTLAQSATNTACHAVAFAGILVFGFLLVKAALGIVTGVISRAVKLPGLHMLDTLGGTALGLLSGAAALLVLGWGLRFMGLWIPEETLAATRLMRLFTDAGLLDRLSISLAAKI